MLKALLEDRKIVKFLLVGAANTAVDLLLFNAIFLLLTGNISHLSPTILTTIRAAAAGGAMIHSYFWNYYWTFKSQKPHRRAFLHFMPATIMGTFISSLVFYLLIKAGVYFDVKTNLVISNLFLLISVAIACVWNFICYERLFRHT